MKDIKVTWKNDGGLRIELAEHLPLDLLTPLVTSEGAVWSGAVTEGEEVAESIPLEVPESEEVLDEQEEPKKRKSVFDKLNPLKR
jgi:hypothetical protein